jgi:hypothetical protein
MMKNTVSHKGADFTLDTIKTLIMQGETDAMLALGSSMK